VRYNEFVEISPEERALLKHYLKASPLMLIRSKSQAILMREKGMLLKDIGDIFSRDRRTISDWLVDWDERRMASIFTGHVGNENAAKLSKEKKEEVKEALGKPPSERGLPKAFWDVPALKTYTQATFGVVYESERSYHFLLKFSNLSFKYPQAFDYRRDEAKIALRMEAIRQDIKPLLNDPSWEVFASDEVRIELEALTRRAWLQRGERTVVKVDRHREAQSFIGFLNQKSFVCETYRMPWQDQEEVLTAFEAFLRKHPNKKLCIVWDNASFHKGKEIRKALVKGGLLERVHLIAMPPYAPDENPIEKVWKDAKGAIANVQHDTLSLTTKLFENHIRKRKFSYRF
jgi:transposase